MTKRSPILGYNHNVRHRGLVFHVQTEDSGVLSPHLFTHLFYGGVIVATRKLVYDVGAVEDVIKNLMQAQHKAVLKDLKKGSFDDKIDQYLGGTPGLLPRDAKDGQGKDEPEPSAIMAAEAAARARDVGTAQPVEVKPADTRPVEAPPAEAPASARTGTTFNAAPPPPKPQIPIIQPRTRTADRGSAPSRVVAPPAPDPGDEPTLTDDAAAVAAAVSAANAATIPNATRAPTPPRVPTPASVAKGVPMPARPNTGSSPRIAPRAPTPPPIPSRTATGSSRQVPMEDSAPEIEISLEGETGRTRSPRDTAVDDSLEQRALTDTAPVERPRNPSERPASHGAATIPPVRPVQRPPSRPLTPPPVVTTRPVPTEDGRARRDSEVIEVYAPAPSSAPPPPGEPKPERPGQGQYVITKKQNEAVPAGLGRPQKLPSDRIPVIRDPGVSKVPDAAPRPRTPTPNRVANRTPPAGSPGVITTRPAVIVGAPQPKPGAPQTQRVRKAREDEGRGFGQGLISEKSLDEVILAYLSEDAEEK